VTEAWPDDPADYMSAYLDAWNAGDSDRVCDAYHVPALIYTEGVVQANLDDAARRAWLGTYVDSTRPELETGARWTCPSLDVTRLGADAAVATARWVFGRADGTVLEDYPDTYLLVRVAGRWVIMADVLPAVP
jgi:uncharacterized protein DUF4440